MKIKVIDKVLLVLICLCMIALCILALSIAIHIIPETIAMGIINILYGNLINSIIIGAISFVILIISIKLLFAGGDKQTVEPRPTAALIKVTDIGATTISLSALDSMVQKHCRNNPKIKDCISSVNIIRDGVSIGIKLALMPDTNIPELTAALQKSLKEYIEQNAGINVLEVAVLIISTGNNPNSRVD